MDLADDDAPDRLFAALDDRNISLDTLVNNVGVGVYGRFGEGSLADQRTQLRLNVDDVVELTHRFLDGRSRGQVLNVGSVAGFTPGRCWPATTPARRTSTTSQKRWRRSTAIPPST